MSMSLVIAPALLVMLAGFAVWLWALIDVLRVPDDSLLQTGTQLVWVLVIVLVPLIGAVLYFAIGRTRRSTADPR